MVDKKVYEDLHSFLFSFIEIEDDKDVKKKSKLGNKETNTFEAYYSKVEESKELVECFKLLVLPSIYIFTCYLFHETIAIESLSNYMEGYQVAFIFMSLRNVYDKSPNLAEAFAILKKIKKLKFKLGNYIQMIVYASLVAT